MTAPIVSPPLTSGMDITGPSSVASRQACVVLPQTRASRPPMQISPSAHRAPAGQLALDDQRRLDRRVAVDDAKSTRLDQADDDALAAEELGDVG